MKKLFLFACLLISAATFAQTTSTSPLEFKEVKHSFGKVPQNVPVTTTFTFTNTSDKTVIIENATAECGCTTPVYPKTPILKGKTGEIKVTYNAVAAGQFTKNVHVKIANVQQPVQLTISGEVVTAPAKTK
ncbi:DUF1573 domain-containing protein [Filimonas effusa]|uniref:DUF1573 domain-containing protein n=1 Tax=Filimonas effusa TaxID=2508721 RepID=A0A4V1M9V3_9BACT|nr:DUF1573 domain-containing protein [Filimonas effusa]RXK82974.1 DUF1573 domain-containing protein [Filimonas effusa]